MSMYSGKYDLADHIGGLGGWFNKEGKPVEFGDKDTSVYFSDEYRDFLAFKKKTGGVLHQHIKVEVTNWNLEFVKEHCDMFHYDEYFDEVPDKRKKYGYKTVVTYTYYYWNKEYTSLKELNKHGVYITIDIHFNTLLDLLPYYPYTISISYCDKGEEVIYISNQSFVIKERNELLGNGYESMWEYYNKQLQDHYREIVLKYYNPEGREIIEELTFDKDKRAFTSKPIDENFYVEWYFNEGEKNAHWENPIVVDYDKGEIEMGGPDYTTFLPHTMKVKYVEKKEYPLVLG